MTEEVDSKIPIINDKKIILQKARDAKKIKKEINERQLQNYNTELENIQNHLIRMNTQLNTLVSIIPPIVVNTSPNPQIKRKREEEDEDEDHQNIKKNIREEAKITIDNTPPSTILSGDFSYMLGQAVAAAVAIGSFVYFKSGKKNINPAHAKYDSMYFQ
jgi:hypothetical protein